MRSVTQLIATFAFQSYFGGNRQLQQTVGSPIVDLTRQYAQTKGVGVALHPCSQSPVAVKFKGGKVDSAQIILTPGQKVIVGPFDEIEWGLPFGWLGGGTSVLYVLHSEAVDVSFPSSRPVVPFHRVQVTIANGNALVVPGTANWPLAFPWTNSTAGSVVQPGAPMFAVDPDVVMMQLSGALALPVTLNVGWVNATPFDLRSPPDQAAGYSNGAHLFEVTFNPVAGPNVASVAWLPRELALLGGDACSFQILDPASALGGRTVDCVRYGRFM